MASSHKVKVSFLTNVSNKELLVLYRNAKIYWHAAGFGVDENRFVEAVEHLGITPLQAMAAGLVTMCHNNGGPARYIADGSNGYLYSSINELVEKTINTTAIDTGHIVHAAQNYVREHFFSECL
ncbi:MAG: Glycosyl transferase group 1 [Microgenomates bacterium OLB23]|nr:MAG: Glycosyl transferase group 1 [Microgenomates bacterium OLB23]